LERPSATAVRSVRGVIALTPIGDCLKQTLRNNFADVGEKASLA
jgi:hypothetical protein